MNAPLLATGSALGLHRLVPRSLLAGKWILVLVGYLDDSGTDRENRIVTLAGYLATDEQWKAFETEVEHWFSEFNVKILHAMDLHRSKREFKDEMIWTLLRKQAFVARICQAMSHHLLMGISGSAVKATFQAHKTKRQETRRRTVTPYTWCLNWIVDNTLRSIRAGKEANTNGLALILECGNQHNAEAEKSFYDIRDQHHLHGVLHSISFVPKDKCRAIQMADLLAFYSRRHGQAIEKAPLNERGGVKPTEMMNLIAGSVPTISFVADNFGDSDEALGSRFFAGPL